MEAAYASGKKRKHGSQAEPDASPLEPPPHAAAQGRGAGLPLFIQSLKRNEGARIQAKLAISQPGDVEEQEANRLSEAIAASDIPSNSIQRKCAACATGATCPNCVQEEKLLQRKADHSGMATAPVLDSLPQSSAAPARALDAPTQSLMESHFGQDFSQVRIHTGASADQSAKSINALAYTVGTDVVFQEGQYAPETAAGKKILAHELTHVVQQKRGTAQREIQRKTAQERIDDHTSWANLDEAALGRELAALLPGKKDEVQIVLEAVGSTDRDDVAYFIVQDSSDEALKSSGTDFIVYLRGQLIGGWTTDEDYRLIGRLDQLKGGISGVEQSATAPTQLGGTPAEIIGRFTSWGALDEAGLGSTLASRATADPALITSVLDQLSSTDRDDVAEAIVSNLSDGDLARCDDNLLQRLRVELMGRIFSYTTDSEYGLAGRLDAAIRTRSLTQPLVAQAPPSAISIEDFIGIIEAEEAKLPPEEQTNTGLMISRFRKLFYGTEGWEKYLIPGAASVTPLYPVTETVTIRHPIEMPYLPNMMDYVEKRATLPTAPEGLREPDRIQEVRMPDGTFIDIGHVFAGLDALNHPTDVTVPVIINIGVSSNAGATTWIGDLGSVLAEAVLKGIETERQITLTEYQEIISNYASPQDMLGNIDSYVIGNAFDVSSTAGLKVSQILRQYYLSEHAARARRYSIFAGQAGLGAFDGSKFANEDTWIENNIDEVNDSAALYIAIHTEGRVFLASTLLQRGPAVVGMAMNAGAEYLIILFVRALKERVRQEGTP